MKKMTKIMLGTLAGVALTATSAMALPVVPDIQYGPIHFKFANYEQISPTGSIVAPSGALEQNWGIVDVTRVSKGLTSVLPLTGYPTDHQLFPQGSVDWNDGATGIAGEITGIFYGLKPDVTNVTDPIASTGGFMDLYFDPNDDFNLVYVAGNRTADDKYIGATEGTFLARIAFLNGAISFGNPNTSIVGSVVPAPGGFTTGVADSFGSIVADVDGDGILYGPGDGVWAQILDTNWFDSWLGDNTADFRFKNSYNPFSNWDGTAPDGTPLIGAISDDPARAFAQPIPEPASMLLLGTGLAGLAGISRRRRKK